MLARRLRRALAGAALACATLVACADRAPTPPADPPGPADHLRLDEAWLVGTHNSYWVDRGHANDAFASGVQESLLDQLLADHARAIEIDVHPDGERPRRYRVFHTVPGNSLCDDLGDCLRPLRLFHAALPRHEPLHVIVELKKFTGPSFDAEHTVDDLEAIFEESLGPWLFRPRDLLALCDPEGADPDPDLAACVETHGWPTIAALRGRFLVTVLGNFDDLLPEAKGTLDWAHFTLRGDLRARSAFSMASSWKIQWDTLPEKIRAELSREDLARALRRVVWLQVEDTADPNLAPFLARNGMVRMGGAQSVADQLERIALGAQVLQGDSPWIQAHDRGPAQPLRPFDADAGEIVEPGERLVLDPLAAGETASALHDVPASSAARWATLPSVGGEADAIPCLVAAASADATSHTSFAVCRDKVRAGRTPGAPLGSGDPDAEKLRLRLRICRDGACAWTDVRAEDVAPGASPDETAALATQLEIGLALGLEVEPQGGGACARALVATDVDVQGDPVWLPVGVPECFPAPLAAQGLLAVAGTRPGALFAGTRLWIDARAAQPELQLHPVTDGAAVAFDADGERP
ncbi:MAG TPA: hypothetical protein VIS07_10560 [Candidatus Binatia bacterium]